MLKNSSLEGQGRSLPKRTKGAQKPLGPRTSTNIDEASTKTRSPPGTSGSLRGPQRTPRDPPRASENHGKSPKTPENRRESPKTFRDEQRYGVSFSPAEVADSASTSLAKPPVLGFGAGSIGVADAVKIGSKDAM